MRLSRKFSRPIDAGSANRRIAQFNLHLPDLLPGKLAVISDKVGWFRRDIRALSWCDQNSIGSLLNPTLSLHGDCIVDVFSLYLPPSPWSLKWNISTIIQQQCNIPLCMHYLHGLCSANTVVFSSNWITFSIYSHLVLQFSNFCFPPLLEDCTCVG